MNYIVLISRVLVGSLFIVSGLVKANDPLGFSYKLEEYFSPKALTLLEFMEPWALALAIFICIAEVALGIALLIGGKPKLSAWISLLMILFFSWLTFYTATCDPTVEVSQIVNGEEIIGTKDCVTDCGCFGDAIKLTPWQSFSKDLVLLVFVLIIFFSRRRITLNTFKDDAIVVPGSLLLIAGFSGLYIGWWFPLLFTAISLVVYMGIKAIIKHKQIEWILAAVMFLIAGIFTFYCLNNLPIKDFRPYAVGKSIPDQMVLPEGAVESVFETMLTYRNKLTGEEKEFTMDNYPWQDTATWAWVSTDSKQIVEGDEPPIHDFSIVDPDGIDVTEDYLANDDYTFFLVAYNLEETETSVQEAVNRFVEAANMDGKYFIGLTASGSETVNQFRHDYQSLYDYYTGDGTTYKTMIRSNPGLILLKNGVVLAKWHHRNFPTYEEVKTTYF